MFVHKAKDTDKREHFIKHLVYILTVTRGQSPFQKKDWLSLKTNHVAAHARKKLPHDKRWSRRKFLEKDRVPLNLQLHHNEIQASRKWSPYFFGPCKIRDHIVAPT
ncbi:hypothetical protein B296_00044461 [Ensete ventricosum]|uniref:Uncharacterized protein n=1 Tax=Ensete ventricosum TaxID=4639 RepID=A0A426WYP3_ENSVE|nr:hypothetical protein B296_00044461 [Ensete ventricosum]